MNKDNNYATDIFCFNNNTGEFSIIKKSLVDIENIKNPYNVDVSYYYVYNDTQLANIKASCIRDFKVKNNIK